LDSTPFTAQIDTTPAAVGRSSRARSSGETRSLPSLLLRLLP